MATGYERDLAPEALATWVLAQIGNGLTYARARGRTFSGRASLVRLATLVLAASSTVILGLQDLNVWASIAFSMVAVTTLVGAVDSFFNWRARWVLMEEMMGRLHRLEDELRYFLAKTPPGELRTADLDEYFARLQDVWADSSRQWIEARRGDPHQ